MFKAYDNWPMLARDAFKKDFSKIDLKDIDHVVLSGMGGSGAIGDIIAAILSREDIHVSVVKGYLLPKTVDEKTLVINTSISGNTKETLSILDYKLKSNAKFVAISSGGMMEKKCKESSITHFNIPMIHSPRASFVTFLYAILNIFENSLPIEKLEVLESLEKMDELQRSINSDHLDENNPALRLAENMNLSPLIYYPDGFKAAAIRFKNSLQENAKMHVIIEDVIEACHNGIVSWNKHDDVNPIFIQGTDDHEKTKERWRILQDFFDKEGIEYIRIKSVDGGILSKLVCLSYQLDYASLYKAILNDVDPSPVFPIDFIKERLTEINRRD